MCCLYVSEELVNFDFTFKKEDTTGFRRLSFSLGAVSATSWYSAFILAFVPRDLDIPLYSLVVLYFGLLIAAIVGGQVMHALAKKLSQ